MPRFGEWRGVTGPGRGAHAGLFGEDRRLTSARNRRLIEICKHVRTADGNVVEAIASGIPATLASLRDAGMPDPRFFDQGLMFTVTLDRLHKADQASPPAPRTRLTPAERELMAALVREMDVHELAGHSAQA